MVVGTETEVLGLIAVADEVRESSKSVLEKLHHLGIKKTVMLTGDNKRAASAIGDRVGVSEIQAELMPEDKLNTIKQLRSEYGKVAMVGDGVNDAPALSSFYCWYCNGWCWNRYCTRNSRRCVNG